MEKQTAVEWIEDKIQSDMTFIEIFGLIRQAKEMEKEQIIKAAARGYLAAAYSYSEKFKLEDGKDYAKQYYNETFGGKDII